MKNNLLTVLGIGLPLVLMMLLWQWLSAAPAPARHRKPQPAQQPTVQRAPRGEPGSLKWFQPASLPAGSSTEEGASAWTNVAESWIDQLEDAARRNPDAQRTAAAMLLSQQRFEPAAAAFDRLLVHDANDPMLLTGKAMALSGMDRHDDALPLFESAIRLDAANPATHFNYAIALMRSGQRDEAAQSLLRAVQLQPVHAKAWFNLAILYQAAGKQVEAREIWRKLTDGDPTSRPAGNARPSSTTPLAARLTSRMLVDAWSHRGETALDLKDPAEAEMSFLNVVRLEPRSAVGWCNVGIARAEQVRRSAALTALRIALELDPDLVPALNQAAYIHAAMFRDTGEVEHGQKVADYCRRSLKLKPDQQNVIELLRAARYFDRAEQEAAERARQVQ